jgi:hypothetical protein
VDPLDGVWTDQLQIVENGKITADEGMLSMMLRRVGDELSGATENFLDELKVEGKVGEKHKIFLNTMARWLYSGMHGALQSTKGNYYWGMGLSGQRLRQLRQLLIFR